jgi:hypothetical protein
MSVDYEVVKTTKRAIEEVYKELKKRIDSRVSCSNFILALILIFFVLLALYRDIRNTDREMGIKIDKLRKDLKKEATIGSLQLYKGGLNVESTLRMSLRQLPNPVKRLGSGSSPVHQLTMPLYMGYRKNPIPNPTAAPVAAPI